MKHTKNLLVGLLALTFGCSNPNSEFIDKVKQQVKDDAMGVEINYKNIEFEWTDTLYVKQQLATLSEQFDERLKTIMDFEFYIKDDFKKGMIFTKDYLTKDRLIELRNFQNKVRDYLYPNSEYKSYYEWLFDKNNCDSEWCNTLRREILYMDSIINNYNDLKETDLDFLKSICWHYKYIDSYNSNKNPDVIWDKIDNEISELKDLKVKTDSLATLDPNMVIHYKALNTYKINNPILNGAEQELKKYFIFNSQFEIIGKEDFEK
jgi:hypothetical protein